MFRTLLASITRLATMSTPPKVPIPRRGVDYRGKVVLAPMVRSGELPTRILALRYGADLVWGPETIDRSLIGTTRRFCERTKTVLWTRMPSNKRGDETPRESVIYRVHPELEGKKLVFQLGTADPELAVAAARLVAADVAGIDVNAGCPKPFSTLGGMGAALLKTPDRLCAILEALVREISPEFEIGISVKIRLLAKAEETEALVRRLCRTGITGLTVHCRTTPMRPRERAIRQQLSMIAGVCREAGVACLMNGDVDDRDHAMELVNQYNVDGAMIATCAEKNPTVFRSKKDGGKLPWRRVVEEYMPIALAVENRWANTKFLLSQFIPGREPTYMAATKSRSFEQLVTAIGMESLAQQARELDARYGFGSLEDAEAPKRQTISAPGHEESTPKRAKMEDDQSFGAAATLRSAVSV
jgi:tRNA-dihydrouridine synthase 2